MKIHIMLCIISTASLLTLQMDHLRINHFSCVIFLFYLSSFQYLGHFILKIAELMIDTQGSES